MSQRAAGKQGGLNSDLINHSKLTGKERQTESNTTKGTSYKVKRAQVTGRKDGKEYGARSLYLSEEGSTLRHGSYIISYVNN